MLSKCDLCPYYLSKIYLTGATSIAANVTNITVTEGDDVTICISPSTDNSENFTVSVEVSSSSTAMNGSGTVDIVCVCVFSRYHLVLYQKHWLLYTCTVL